MNLASILKCHADSHGDKTAIEYRNERISYLELWQRLQGYAVYLHTRGIRPGDRVGLALKEHPDHLILHYALARLGAVILPVDQRWTPTEKAGTAAAFKVKLLILDDDLDAPEGIQTLTLNKDIQQTDPGHLPQMPERPDAALLISLSSGTTGKPKGALVTHEQMYQRFISQWVTIGFNSGDRFLGLTPIFFGAGRSFAMSFLAAGATVIIDPPPHEPEQLVAAVNASGATVTFMVPTQLRGLLPLHKKGLLLLGLDKLLISGAALYPQEIRDIREKVCPGLIGYYASSEGGGISVLNTGELDDYAHTAGRATFRTEVQIVDSGDRLLNPGETGRLRYRGPGVAGRFIDTDGTEQAIDSEGWFYPGDLAEKTDSGHIILRGRDKDVINRGGINVYPAEVEAILMQLPAVRETAVVGEASEKFGETVTAFIAADETIPAQVLDGHCGERLAPYKLPSRYVFLDQLPRKASGKLDKQALVEETLKKTCEQTIYNQADRDSFPK